MIRVVNVQFLVNDDDIERIHQGLASILDKVAPLDQTGASKHPLILDYQIGKQTSAVASRTQQEVREGRYDRGDAFLGDDGSDLYMLVTVGDVEPVLQGPFATDTARCAAAVDYRQQKDHDDGLYRIDVAKGSRLRVEPITGVELDANRDPVVESILAKLAAGEEPIYRLLPTGTFLKYFTVYHEGDEVVVTLDMVNAIEREFKDQLVVVVRPTSEVIVTMTKATEYYPVEFWRNEVRKGTVSIGYQDWLQNQVSGLRLAVDLLGEMDESPSPERVEAINLTVRPPPQSS